MNRPVNSIFTKGPPSLDVLPGWGRGSRGSVGDGMVFWGQKLDPKRERGGVKSLSKAAKKSVFFRLEVYIPRPP